MTNFNRQDPGKKDTQNHPNENRIADATRRREDQSEPGRKSGSERPQTGGREK